MFIWINSFDFEKKEEGNMNGNFNMYFVFKKCKGLFKILIVCKRYKYVYLLNKFKLKSLMFVKVFVFLFIFYLE